MPVCWKCKGTGIFSGIACILCSIIVQEEHGSHSISTGMVDEQTMLSHLSEMVDATPPIYPAYKIYNAMVGSEYIALSPEHRQYFDLLISQGLVDMSEGKNAKTTLWTLFGEGSGTRANLIALIG